MASGGTDRPTATEEINLVVGVDASGEVQRQMEVQQAGVGTRTQYDALFFLSLAQGRTIKVVLFSQQQVRRVFFADGCGTRHALAEIIARRFPEELGFRLPPKRRPWMP